jgi:acyl carrier protein
MTQVDSNFIIQGIAEALEVEVSQVTIDTRSSDVEEWDSLGHISIMSFLDKSYNEITERVPDFASATSVQEILDLITQNS